MSVTIQLSTLFTGSSYFAGNTAQRHSFESINIGLPGSIPVMRDSFTISQSDATATLTFNNVPAGIHIFCIKGSNNQIRWRSPAVNISSGNESFAFTIIPVPVADVTFTSEQIETFLQEPDEDGNTIFDPQDIDGIDEKLTLSRISVMIQTNNIDIDGNGRIEKENGDFSLLQSDLDFDYDFNIIPSNSILNSNLVKVEPLSSSALTLNASNLITSIGIACMMNEINQIIKKTIEKNLNTMINTNIRNRVGDRFGRSEQVDFTTANILKVSRVRTGTRTLPSFPTDIVVPIHSLEFLIDISIPTSLLGNRQGCLGAFALLLIFLITGLTILFIK